MKIIAFIEDEEVIEKILRHLGQLGLKGQTPVILTSNPHPKMLPLGKAKPFLIRFLF